MLIHAAFFFLLLFAIASGAWAWTHGSGGGGGCSNSLVFTASCNSQYLAIDVP